MVKYFMTTLKRGLTNNDTDIIVFRALCKDQVLIYCAVNRRPIMFFTRTTEKVYKNILEENRVKLE
jgi:hypothetical protein